MKTYLTGLGLLMLSILSAQNCNITFEGQIIDFHDNQALPEAKIYIKGINQTRITDENGYFVIQDLCPGEYEVEVTHNACEPLFEKIDLTDSTEVTWFLEHHIIQLENIETKGQQNRAVSTQDETHIHRDEINKNSIETLGYLLKSVSGVSGLETGNNIIKPMIHGMHSSRIIMMNQGVRQEDMEWGVEHAPNLDLNAFEDIRIIKGASALRYGGDAIGGIVLTELPRLLKQDSLRGQVSVTGISNGKGGNINAFVQKGFSSPWSFQTQASLKKHGDYQAPDYNLSNTGSDQKAFTTEVGYGDFKQNFRFSYSYFETNLGIMKASHLGNLNDLANAINATNPSVVDDFSYKIDKPYQHIQHHLAKIKWEKRFQNFGKIEAQYALQFNKRQEFDVRTGEVTDLPSMDVELTTHSAEVYLLLDKIAHFQLEIGIDYSFQQNYSDPLTQNKRLIPDFDKYKAGSFVSANYRPNRHWQLQSGLRYDYMFMNTKKYYYKRYWQDMGYDQNHAAQIIGNYGNEWLTHFKLNYHNLSGSFGASYSPNNDIELAINYAYANRAPNPSELFSEGLHHSAVSIELGDVDLAPEKAHKLSFNYRHHIPVFSGIQWNVLAYYNHILDYIYQIPTGATYTIRGAFPVWQYKQINADISGFDIDVEVDFTPRLNWKNQWSYVYANDKTHNIPLIQMPPMEWQQEISYQWPTDAQPYVSLGTQWVAYQNRFADYNFSLNVLENGQEVTKLVDISTPPSSYFLMQIKTGFSLDFFKRPLQLNAKVSNVLNTSYRNYLNRFRYYADEMGRQFQLQLIYNF